jgi:uncharacterized protein YukE
MDSMRYNHAMMADHVAAQNSLVQHCNDLRQQALNVLANTADFWTNKGANAYTEAQRAIDQAFQSVFETVGRHGSAISQASTSADMSDAANAARFTGI